MNKGKRNYILNLLRTRLLATGEYAIYIRMMQMKDGSYRKVGKVLVKDTVGVNKLAKYLDGGAVGGISSD